MLQKEFSEADNDEEEEIWNMHEQDNDSAFDESQKLQPFKYSREIDPDKDQYLRSDTDNFKFESDQKGSDRQMSLNLDNPNRRSSPKASEKARKSKTLILHEESINIFEEPNSAKKEEDRRLQHRPTQEFSIVVTQSKDGNESPLQNEIGSFIPAPSYPKPGQRNSRLSFALQVLDQEKKPNPQEIDKNKEITNYNRKENPLTQVKNPVRPKLSDDRKRRPSSIDLFVGKMDESVNRYISDKEKELAKNKNDRDLIEQITREVKQEKVDRERRASQMVSQHLDELKKASRREIPHIRNDSDAQVSNILDQSALAKEQSVPKSLRIIERDLNFPKEKDKAANQQPSQLIFDNSLSLPSPIPRQEHTKYENHRNSEQSKKVLEIFSLDIHKQSKTSIDAHLSSPSPKFAETQEISQLLIPSSKKTNRLEHLKLNRVGLPSGQVQQRTSIVEYIVKSTDTEQITLKQFDQSAIQGLAGAIWEKCHRLMNILHKNLPEYALDMHACIDVDTLLTIVDKELSKMKTAVTDLTHQLESTRVESKKNRDRIVEVEEMFKVVVANLEASKTSKRPESFSRETSQRQLYQEEGQHQDQIIKGLEHSQRKGFSNRQHSILCNDEDTPDQGIKIENVLRRSHKADHADQQKQARIELKSDSYKGDTSLHQFLLNDPHKNNRMKMPWNELELWKGKNRNTPSSKRTGYSSTNNYNHNQSSRLIQFNTQKVNEKNQIQQEEDSADPEMLETHFTYRLTEGKYTLKRNESATKHHRDCSCSSLCLKKSGRSLQRMHFYCPPADRFEES